MAHARTTDSRRLRPGALVAAAVGIGLIAPLSLQAQGSGAPPASALAGSRAEARSIAKYVIVEGDRRIEIEKTDGRITSATLDGQPVPPERVEETDGRLRFKDEQGNVIFEHTPPAAIAPGAAAPEMRRFRARAAVPVEAAPAAAPSVMLGIQMTEPESTLRGHLGLERGRAAMLTAVHDGLPAANAGLEPYDIIVAVDGDEQAGPADLRRLLADKKPGDTLRLTVLHRGQRKDVTLTLEAYDRERLEKATVETIAAGEERDRFMVPGHPPMLAPLAPGMPEDLRPLIERYMHAVPGRPLVGTVPGQAGGEEDQLFIQLHGDPAQADADRFFREHMSRAEDMHRRMEEHMRRMEGMLQQLQERQHRLEKLQPTDPQAQGTSTRS